MTALTLLAVGSVSAFLGYKLGRLRKAGEKFCEGVDFCKEHMLKPATEKAYDEGYETCLTDRQRVSH